MLCVHGAKHFWERIAWIVDIAQLAGNCEVDWALLSETAAKKGSTRVLLLGLFLAHDVQRIQAARGFIEHQHRRLVQHGARQAEPVNVPRRKSPHLAVEQLAEAKWTREIRNPPGGLGTGKIIEVSKQNKVLSRTEA